MKRSAFGFLEMVFAVVIIGMLAGAALYWLATTRNDSQVAVARSDLANALKAVPSFVFASNIEVLAKTPPNGYKSWGEYILDISSLDKRRWRATANGVQVVSNTAGKNGNQVCSGNYLYIDDKTGKLYFIPSNIDKSLTFCRLLAESYKDANMTIELVSSSSLKMN